MVSDLNYPDIYYRIHPYVLQVCNQWKYANAPINESTLEAMTDHACALALQSDPVLQNYFPDGDLRTTQIRGGLLRDIISIILIGELLGRGGRRRRRIFRP